MKMKEFINQITAPQVLIFIGGFLAVVGAFWSTYEDNIKEKIINKKNQIIIDKTEEISSLNARIVSVLTGGDSYPYVMIAPPDGIPLLQLHGDFAIPNVTGTIIDIRELRKHQRKFGFTGQFKSDDFKKDIISPAFGALLINKKFNVKQGGRFLVHFYTPYHTFQQRIAVEIDSTGGYMNAFEIYKDNELIYSNYPKNFPISKEEINYLEDFTEEEVEELRKKADPKFSIKGH